jgi:hypothetical protein
MRPRSSIPPARRRHFTPQQAIILVLVGLLGLAWIAAGTAFVYSSLRPARASAPVARLSPQAAPSVPPAPRAASPAALPTAPVSCAQHGRGLQQGLALGMVEPGVLEVDLEGQTFPVSLAGVALPPGADQRDRLSQGLRALAEGRPVLLVQDTSDRDASGRLVRYVFVGGVFLNDAAVREGWALADRDGPDQACGVLLQQAEAQARTVRAGLWQPAPAPTATFMPFVTLDPAARAGCDCSAQAACADFASQTEAQVCYNACNDYNSQLDLDRDGVACETLP